MAWCGIFWVDSQECYSWVFRQMDTSRLKCLAEFYILFFLFYCTFSFFKKTAKGFVFQFDFSPEPPVTCFAYSWPSINIANQQTVIGSGLPGPLVQQPQRMSVIFRIRLNEPGIEKQQAQVQSNEGKAAGCHSHCVSVGCGKDSDRCSVNTPSKGAFDWY